MLRSLFKAGVPYLMSNHSISRLNLRVKAPLSGFFIVSCFVDGSVRLEKSQQLLEHNKYFLLSDICAMTAVIAMAVIVEEAAVVAWELWQLWQHLKQ
jgi:hypothetical protein